MNRFCHHASDTDGADVCAVIELDDGNVITQTTTNPSSDRLDGDIYVLFQRGLLPNPKELDRCHENILSPYLICGPHSKSALVPWRSFSWISPQNTPYLVDDLPCGCCMKARCEDCIKNITHRNVKVVWIHNKLGGARYQWFIVKDRPTTYLTPIPHAFVSMILKNLRNKPQCTCGGCHHPLRSMVNRRKWPEVAASFCKDAANAFCRYRKRVHQNVEEKRRSDPKRRRLSSPSLARNPAPKQDTGSKPEKGMCCVCLEDTLVLKSTCTQKRCSTDICLDCHEKLRGLCPICDRKKLSSSSKFLCHTCNRFVRLDEFGHRCITCCGAHLCTKCFESFGQCLICECDNA